MYVPPEISFWFLFSYTVSLPFLFYPASKPCFPVHSFVLFIFGIFLSSHFFILPQLPAFVQSNPFTAGMESAPDAPPCQSQYHQLCWVENVSIIFHYTLYQTGKCDTIKQISGNSRNTKDFAPGFYCTVIRDRVKEYHKHGNIHKQHCTF